MCQIFTECNCLIHLGTFLVRPIIHNQNKSRTGINTVSHFFYQKPCALRVANGMLSRYAFSPNTTMLIFFHYFGYLFHKSEIQSTSHRMLIRSDSPFYP